MQRSDTFLTIFAISILVFLVGGIMWLFQARRPVSPVGAPTIVLEDRTEVGENIQIQTLRDFPHTDLASASIPLDQILSGGPGRDGIPAMGNPMFVSIEAADLSDEIEGVFIDIDGVQRFYPFTILVWHEIVNDVIGDTPFAVTFCPLCGSAITFDRRVSERVYEFGVSGYLYESNMLMYDRQTESLWSQALGEAVVGVHVGDALSILPMQQITIGQLREDFPDAVVMSTDTGHIRNYGVYPYGDYEETARTIFPVSVSDQRYFAKEIMYVMPIGDTSVALPKDQLEDTAEMEIDGQILRVERDGGRINATLGGESIPGYFEMWFSWATHHHDSGIVWDLTESGN